MRYLLVLFLFPLLCHSQSDTAFIRHLSQQQLKTEHYTYLSNLQLEQDSTHYWLAKYHLSYFEDSLFFSHVEQSIQLFIHDTTACNFASNYFLGHENAAYRNRWFTQVSQLELPHFATLHLNCFLAAASPKKELVSTFPNSLQDDYTQLVHCSKKKPWLAASLAIIPGLGQLYIGHYRSFIIEFVSLSISALQLTESTSKEGILHPLSILNTGFLTAFYTSGIVGAYRDTKMIKKDAQTQFLLHATQYYRNRCAFRLY